MDEKLYQQIEAWHKADEHQQIIQRVLSIPREEWDYRLTCLLARAYVNTQEPENWDKALSLLLSVEEEGKTDPEWYFRTGGVLCRLLRKEEAQARFQEGFALLPPDSEARPDWERRCTQVLAFCQQELDRKAAWERYGDSLDPEKALDFYLNGLLHGGLQDEDRVEGNAILLPRQGIRILPQVEQISQRGAVVNLWLPDPQRGQRLVGCSVGMGCSPTQALGLSASSFIFSFLEGVMRMEDRVEPRELETLFDGKAHRWELYPSNIVGLGSAPQPEGQVWWELLGEDIQRRLGNQRVCYVKIYGAKVDGQVTGECRVDDIKSEELSAKVAQAVERWPAGQFASQKQFFFIRQQEETILPYPYEGAEGERRLRSALGEAVRMFMACRTEEDYDQYSQRLGERIGDETLADECLTFLPELCAANAFPQLQAAETVEICREGRPPETVYKNQLADYYPLWTLLLQLFQEEELGADPDAIYREYVGYSSTCNVVRQMEQQGSRLEDCRLASLLCQMGSGFQLR